jgi:hypothetical protein
MELGAVATIRVMKAAIHTRYGPPDVVRANHRHESFDSRSKLETHFIIKSDSF